MTDTFTNRKIENWRIVSKTGNSVREAGGWNIGLPEDVADKIIVGQEYQLEFRGSRITGVLIDGQWVFHQTDAELERERQEFVDRIHREHEEQLVEHREEWATREQQLPNPLQARLHNFRQHGGHEFDRDGWMYELIVCELAQLYAASHYEDTPQINEYARKHGTSSNQHGYAKALARLLDTEPEKVGTTVSALTPITGDPYFEGR